MSTEAATVVESKPERWERLGLRLATFVGNQPDMLDTRAPRRWARLLLEWGCEAMRLAYPKDTWQQEVKEAVGDFMLGSRGGGL